MNGQQQDAWRDAQRRCRLSDDEVRMAKELGLQPGSLIRNIPASSEQWKGPASAWLRTLYEQRIGSGRQAAEPPPRGIEYRNADDPWPDNPPIPDLAPIDFDEPDEYPNFEPPSGEDIDEQNGLQLRRQRLFRWAAQSIAVAISELPAVRKVAAFGAVAQPLQMEVPRFKQYRRHRIEVLHECADLDLAVWMSDFDQLKSLKKAMGRGLSIVQDTPYGGVAHHQVDMHLFDAAPGDYCGRLCSYGECPKPGKRDCLVPGCGAHAFLQQFEGYRFRPAQFAGESKVILFDRAGGFLVRLPRIEGKLREVRWREIDLEDQSLDDENSPA
jgi:hypothetical protein